MKYIEYENNILIDFYVQNGLEDDFYFKSGFVYDNVDLIDEECKMCDKYKITCFPNVVVYK